ncbi:MAG: FAD/NAD(P)-binding protein [Stenotrophomonas sp.]
MTATEYPRRFDLAIIGGGAAGVLTAIHLLRNADQPLHIALIEPHRQLAQGVAYATRYPEHLLNVPAAKMSGFDGQPEDFLDYIVEQAAYPGLDRDTLARTYVSRGHYARYLQARLQQARAASVAQLQVLEDRVVALEKADDGFQLALQQGAPLQVTALALATGNALRPLPARGAAALSARQRVEAWDFDAVRDIAPEADLCIVGTGLSMVDSVVTLLDSGHRGAVHVISRHALLPLPHAEGAAADYDPQPLLAMGLRQRMRTLRRHAADAQARGIPWQSVMDRIRPLGQALWQSLSADDQRRFLRHVVRYWDVHRHRIAAPVYAQLQQIIQRGQLQQHRGRLDAVIAEGACVQVLAQDAQRRPLRLDVQCVINATGVEMRVQAMHSPLLQQMLGSGQAGSGPHGIGIDTTVEGSLLDAYGIADPRVQVIGSLRIGRLWESLAVPELRAQAQQAALALLSVSRSSP